MPEREIIRREDCERCEMLAGDLALAQKQALLWKYDHDRLVKERETASASHEGQRRNTLAFKDDAATAEAVSQARLEALQAVEWVPSATGRAAYVCPFCGAKEPVHAPDCRLRAALEGKAT